MRQVAFEKMCVECGRVFTISYHENRKVCCSVECKIKHTKKVDAARYQEQKEERKAEREAKKQKVEEEVKPVRRRKIPSLDEIAVLARKAGMTYGQYVAKYEYDRGW